MSTAFYFYPNINISSINRKEYDEYFIDGIFANPDSNVMKMLESSKTIEEVAENLPDYTDAKPDIIL